MVRGHGPALVVNQGRGADTVEQSLCTDVGSAFAGVNTTGPRRKSCSAGSRRGRPPRTWRPASGRCVRGEQPPWSPSWRYRSGWRRWRAAGGPCCTPGSPRPVHGLFWHGRPRGRGPPRSRGRVPPRRPGLTDALCPGFPHSHAGARGFACSGVCWARPLVASLNLHRSSACSPPCAWDHTGPRSFRTFDLTCPGGRSCTGAALFEAGPGGDGGWAESPCTRADPGR